MKPPEGMTPGMRAKFLRLNDEQRYAVLERSAIIQEACNCSWAEADSRALAEELQLSLRFSR